MNHSPRFLRTFPLIFPLHFSLIFSPRRCFAVAAAVVVSGVLVAQASAAQPISVAETLLFQTNHLHNVRAPQTLTYAMRKEGSLEPGFVDEVQVIFTAGTAAKNPSVTMHFLTGARERPVPDTDNPEGNPVLLGFLERDIAEMARLTGGAGNYFRKRIRLALAESAQVQPRRITYAGKAFDGREISITPYLNDPMHQRFEQYVNKRYTFVVSDKVPGGLYQIHAAVAGAAGKAPLMDETLTLVSAESGKR
ncbi:MAG: hypothetical protein H7335_11885 [Massilia sp.]|nr:hypothetical protein [Massilia sp.]